jgi:hypothetical protein
LELHVFDVSPLNGDVDVPKFRGLDRMPLSHGLLQTKQVQIDLQAEFTNFN